jgi:dipeptidyl aminopeptidase/acylaminoacyl peptidase
LFRAAICRYAVTDLKALYKDTHKFEAFYLHGLIGDPRKQERRYLERSPLHRADQIQDPVAIFQGDEDRVVPPDQAGAIVASLRERGIPYHYRLFPGEGHGWRKKETILQYYREVEGFLARHVG